MTDPLREYKSGDLGALVALLVRLRRPETLAQYPTPIDLQELFASGEIRRSTRLMEDMRGNLVGYVLVDPRFCNIFFEAQTVEVREDREAILLDWGIAHFGELKREGRIAAEDPLDTNCEEGDRIRVALLESRGFSIQDLLSLHFECPLSGPLPPVALPEGFHIRPVAGEQEVDEIVALYHAAYGTQTMTREDVVAIQGSADYERELDLLAVAPDGRLAGLCTCSIDRALNRVLPRPTGCTDPVLVHPDFQGRGLAGALIHRGWELLVARGIEVASLGTSSRNVKAIAAFSRAGYREVSRRRWYSKRVDLV